VADLGTRYATALFELSQEQGMLAQYLEEATFVRDALQDEEVKGFITHPRVAGADKIAFFEKAFKAHIHEHLMGFMQLAVTKNREAFLLPALNQLVEMIRRHQNQTTARVVSAVALTDTQLAHLAAVLSRKLGKQVDVLVQVDPAVIGGISIHVDGFYMDHTLRFLLRNLKDEVRETCKRGASHDTQA